ncbi:helix-turn-helix transcriptional regulator [Acidipila sp. EB88]|uniref:ArsR/SmtB family transcription factor n=1 Tax=Acidipila sp. EB88 TaxID=2305226 RepID=UPI000F5DF749|nr:metalloregulator ArsR/SmtB family transcription factor [Acidipila sp. EB88]RRA48623.1 ArsR family transcriptional regulator [Acidipila sp. EB88]
MADEPERTRPANTLDEKQMLLIARALADPRRYSILKQMACQTGPCTPCASMRDCLEISPATLSHHMRELRLAGLVSESREGRSVSYELCRDVVESYTGTLHRDLL